MMRIYCGLPIYQSLHPACARSIENLETWIRDTHPDWHIHYQVIQHEPIINLARQYLFGRFLEQHERSPFDYYWQLDSDIWFPPSAVERALSHQRQCISGIYTFKTDPGNKGYQVPVLASTPGATVDENHLLECDRLPGGFLFIKASSLVRLTREHPTFRYRVHKGYDSSHPNYCETYAFWQGLLRPIPRWGKGVYACYEEDYAFTTRIREWGLKLYADTSIYLRHCGPGRKWYDLPFGDEPMVMEEYDGD